MCTRPDNVNWWPTKDNKWSSPLTFYKQYLAPTELLTITASLPVLNPQDQFWFLFQNIAGWLRPITVWASHFDKKFTLPCLTELLLSPHHLPGTVGSQIGLSMPTSFGGWHWSLANTCTPDKPRICYLKSMIPLVAATITQLYSITLFLQTTSIGGTKFPVR